jgi:hypothetical protein
MHDPAAHLTFRGGRYRWTGWTLRPLADGGIGVCVPCDLGAHWLAQAADGALVTRIEPYAWLTAEEASAAVERFEQQEQRNLAAKEDE